jgi:hypothetical protein
MLDEAVCLCHTLVFHRLSTRFGIPLLLSVVVTRAEKRLNATTSVSYAHSTDITHDKVCLHGAYGHEPQPPRQIKGSVTSSASHVPLRNTRLLSYSSRYLLEECSCSQSCPCSVLRLLYITGKMDGQICTLNSGPAPHIPAVKVGWHP